MKGRVNTALRELISAIIDSPEYREFDHQLSIMKEHPELKRQIDEFRQENYVLQRTAESDELFDKLDEFSQRYDSFRRNPLVDPFLNAEAEDGVNLSLPFLGFCGDWNSLTVFDGDPGEDQNMLGTALVSGLYFWAAFAKEKEGERP